MNWRVYIVRCSDGTLYIGSTTDLSRRLKEHNAGRGAAYTRGRIPVELLYDEGCESRASAQRRESEMKKFSRSRKIELIHPGG